jgi:hypothetical protein
MMSNKDEDRISGEEIAFRGMTNYRPPTDAEVQAGIDATMRAIINKGARHNPNALAPPAAVRVEGAPRVVDGETRQGRGWVDPGPLELPPGQDAIERLVNAALPHGPGSKAK